MTNFSTQSRRRFKPETKLQIVQEALSGNLSKAAVARKYDVNTNQVCRWIREYQSGAHWVPNTRPALLPLVIASEPEVSAISISENPVLPVPADRQTANVDVSVRFNSGHQLSVNSASPEHLAALIEALK